MNPRDEKIRLEILKTLYEAFDTDAHHYSRSNDDLYDELDDFDEDEIDYILDRIDGEHIELQKYLGGKMDAEITSGGIEFLQRQGVSTFLESDTRYDMLEIMYEEDRDSHHAVVGIDEFNQELDSDENELIMNIRYLKQKRCLELFNGFRGVTITDYGRGRYENYRDDGVEIPSTSLTESTNQAEIGKGEGQLAENLFRDIVELAQSEVIVLDRYSKEGLFKWIDKHVPSGVQVRVLTSGRVTGGSYAQDIKSVLSNPATVEVKELPNQDWDFHDRYVFRDKETGWSWGHSFHDSGDRQHTANELKPVNRDTVLQEFENSWNRASQVI